MKTAQLQVIEFHKACDQPILERPTVPSDDRVRLRASLVVKEAFEFLAALFPTSYDITALHVKVMQAIEAAPVNVNLVEAIDALADINYVVAGSYLEFGVDSQPIEAEVHRANMTKANGPRSPQGKVMKPPGFRPPDIAGELEFQAKAANGGLGQKLLTLRNAFHVGEAIKSKLENATEEMLEKSGVAPEQPPPEHWREGIGRGVARQHIARRALGIKPTGEPLDLEPDEASDMEKAALRHLPDAPPGDK